MEGMGTLWTASINIFLISFIPLSLLLNETATAHTLQNVKGEKVLMLLEPPLPAVGDLFVVQDAEGAEKAQIQIRQIKDKRAVAYVIKGTLSPQSLGGTQITPLILPKAPLFSAKGYYLGYSQNQMNIGLTSSTSLGLSGSSYNLGAFFESPLSPSLQVLARVGYEGLKAQGALTSSACGGDCKVDIGYLSADAVLKYSLSETTRTWWFGAGLGFLYPLMKSSNILDTSKITFNERILLGGGLNWFFKPQNYIPFQVEYSLQPSTKVVSTRQILVRLGYGVSF